MSWPIDIEGYRPAHMSYSTADGYRMCPKKHFLGKVLRLEQRPGLAGIAGNAIHAVCDRIDEHILEHGFGDEQPSVSTETDTRSERVPTRDECGF